LSTEIRAEKAHCIILEEFLNFKFIIEPLKRFLRRRTHIRTVDKVIKIPTDSMRIFLAVQSIKFFIRRQRQIASLGYVVRDFIKAL
jgi:hypothetical protein